MAFVPGSSLATALVERVVTYDNGTKRYSCSVCMVPHLAGPDVETHLKGGKHREAAARYALAHVSNAPASLLDLLGPEEKNAAVSGTIEVKDTKQIECVVCHVTLSGLVPLRTHLVSGAHKNKTDFASSKHLVIPKKDSIVVHSSIVPGRCDAPPAISSPSCDAEILYYDDGMKRYSCLVCEMPMSGNVDIENHLVGAKHREAAARYAVSHPTTAPRTVLEVLNQDEIEAARIGVIRVTAIKDFVCTLCQVTLTGLVPLRSHVASDAHKRKSDILPSVYQPSTPQVVSSTAAPSCSLGASRVPPWLELSEEEKQEVAPILSGSPSELGRPGALPDLQRDKRLSSATTQEENELEKALREKIILQTDNLAEPYYCSSCDKKFNSSQTLKDHLNSKKHKKKAADYEYIKSFDNTNADKVQPITPTNREEMTLVKAKQPYTVLTMPRGHVYVFNYAFIGQGSRRRKWAEKDSENIQDTFRKMDYDVFLLENLTQEETLKAFKAIRSNSKLNSVDVLVIFILSHGVDPYTFKTEDGKEMNLLEIRFSFSDQRCPYLRGKPKIFFTNYCRGDQMQVRETDEKDVPNDMVTIHAATEGIMALRQENVGTIFVKSLCNVLNRHAHDIELREIYQMLDGDMKQSRGTRPMWEDYGFRKFYFSPLNGLTCNAIPSLPSHITASPPSAQEIPTNMYINSYTPDHDLNLGTSMRYNLTSNPRGHVYVFNNMFQNHAVDFREGADVDSENIKNTFTQLGYKVILMENLSAQETYNALHVIKSDQTLNTVDCLIIFFLSHGDKPFIFRGEDDGELNLKKIRRMFLNSKCPQLKGKPKLFFTNFCRGVHDQMEIQYDSVREVLTDTITTHASQEGIQAKRHPKLGTLFVYSLCNVLRSHAKSSNLGDIYTMVMEETQMLRGTLPDQENNGFREFFF